jgi:hypothetical protein
LVIPGRQSQTVDVAGAEPLPLAEADVVAEVAVDVAVDEHEAVRVATSSPAATAENRETWCFAPDPDRQVTCISFMRCSVPRNETMRNRVSEADLAAADAVLRAVLPDDNARERVDRRMPR